ncbi:CaiB/BaiF CoA transferase family protein [Natrarchaeobaculum aegyptiacum]|uniref:Carnitine dehydratase n=1 Tax=Natrarchaeobaculum aegyptiacum TaxID=745377 RepID=A0A2Z2I2I2_9EURY|nr:CaiB/BaiF CoA-transferase family protein [Natrarchaeobaculum aegyptiacum]ARS91068.1 carnitine dehydratase [Natrarchaeobaculum aegyptiacum]
MDLSDYTVLDLSWLLPGPYGTMLLADLGADVIKVEDPNRGDYARWAPPTVKSTGTGALFHAVNRNKRSVTIDLKTDEGQAAFLELAEDADAIVEQFRPGVVSRLGVDYETVRDRNEEIVYCSLTGYGQDGPYSDRAGHDLNYLGLSGFLHRTRSRDGSIPAVPGFPIADMTGGLFTAFSVVAALASRELGGGGEYIDLSMTDVATALGTGLAWESLLETGDPGEDGAFAGPSYGVYETADGKYVTVAALEEQFWEQLLAELDREDLREYHDATGEDAAYATAELAAEFASRTRSEWLEDLSPETTVAPVSEHGEVFDHPQLEARDLVGEVDLDDGERVPQVGFPAQFGEELDEFRSAAPGHGEHTREVLSSVLSDEELDRLEEDGVV